MWSHMWPQNRYAVREVDREMVLQNWAYLIKSAANSAVRGSIPRSHTWPQNILPHIPHAEMRRMCGLRNGYTDAYWTAKWPLKSSFFLFNPRQLCDQGSRSAVMKWTAELTFFRKYFTNSTVHCTTQKVYTATSYLLSSKAHQRTLAP